MISDGDGFPWEGQVRVKVGQLGQCPGNLSAVVVEMEKRILFEGK